VLEWAYQLVKNYFAELSAVTGSLNPIEQTQGGRRLEYVDEETCEIEYSISIEERWERLRSRLLPSFYGADSPSSADKRGG
jgi:hypothetical protein